jgi:hypothetical protein
MARPTRSEFNCSICDKRVDLETCKTKGIGKPVHKECYILREALKKATQPTRQQALNPPARAS